MAPSSVVFTYFLTRKNYPLSSPKNCWISSLRNHRPSRYLEDYCLSRLRMSYQALCLVHYLVWVPSPFYFDFRVTPTLFLKSFFGLLRLSLAITLPGTNQPFLINLYFLTTSRICLAMPALSGFSPVSMYRATGLPHTTHSPLKIRSSRLLR